MKHISALIAAIVFVIVFSTIAYGAFGMASNGYYSRGKSDEELCKDRGGVWYKPHRSSGICLAKEMVK